MTADGFHPIMFSTQMVKAVAAGAKSETRRTSARWQNARPERLWVRETYGIERCTGKPLYRADYEVAELANISLRLQQGKWIPAIHMKRQYARIFLDVREIRTERLQDITEAGALAEGVATVSEYAALWDLLNEEPGERWADNPEVTVIRFEVLPA